MIALFKKEIRSYLSSLIGYMVIAIFLLLVSMFMWIFPGDLNVLNGGYANLDSLFYIAPWVFMFLIPAITMKFFAEEIRTGTIELLMTKPISELQIILAKYFAALVLVVIAIIPTIVFLLEHLLFRRSCRKFRFRGNNGFLYWSSFPRSFLCCYWKFCF